MTAGQAIIGKEVAKPQFLAKFVHHFEFEHWAFGPNGGNGVNVGYGGQKIRIISQTETSLTDTGVACVITFTLRVSTV